MTKPLIHRHHIVPKHMGGTDDPSNIVQLTVEEHAEAHRLLYEKYGKQEDYLAWQGLTGIIGHEEAVRRACGLKSKETIKKAHKVRGRKYSAEVNKSRSEKMLGVSKSLEHRLNISKGRMGISFSDEHKRKLSEAAKNRKTK